MKPQLILILFLAVALPVRAGKHQFHVTPFSQIFLVNGKGKESVEVEMGNKFETDTIYKAKLTAKGKGVYESPDGVIFTVKDLAKPEVVNKGLRWEFKSSRTVTITGSGKAYDKLFKELDSDDGKTKDLVFYEEIYEK